MLPILIFWIFGVEPTKRPFGQRVKRKCLAFWLQDSKKGGFLGPPERGFRSHLAEAAGFFLSVFASPRLEGRRILLKKRGLWDWAIVVQVWPDSSWIPMIESSMWQKCRRTGSCWSWKFIEVLKFLDPMVQEKGLDLQRTSEKKRWKLSSTPMALSKRPGFVEMCHEEALSQCCKGRNAPAIVSTTGM